MGDVLIKQGNDYRVGDYRVVSADMPQLKTCAVCGRYTRAEWIFTRPKIDYGNKRNSVWACSTHKLSDVMKLPEIMGD